MSESVTVQTEVRITATLKLTERHLRALNALAGYGVEPFFKAFYIKLGKHYMQPVERDMRELFELIDSEVGPALRRIEEARKDLNLPHTDDKWIVREKTR